MVVCPKCGVYNAEGSAFCRKCGESLTAAKPPEQAAPAVAPVAAAPTEEPKTFERQMEDLGKRIAEAGKKVEQEVRGSEFNWRWYSTLGVLAPIIGGLIATIVFLVFILIVGAVAVGSEHRSFWDELRNFLESYFLLFVGLFFLSSFNNYFNHVQRRWYRWIAPIPIAIGFVGWFWILAQVLFIGARTLTRPGLRDLGDLVISSLPIIFVIVLAIGYLVVLFQYTVEKSKSMAT